MADNSNLLSPEELLALTEGVRDGSIEVDTGFNTKLHVRKHDLASEDSSLGVNVSSIDMINERFIRMFRLRSFGSVAHHASGQPVACSDHQIW